MRLAEGSRGTEKVAEDGRRSTLKSSQGESSSAGRHGRSPLVSALGVIFVGYGLLEALASVGSCVSFFSAASVSSGGLVLYRLGTFVFHVAMALLFLPAGLKIVKRRPGGDQYGRVTAWILGAISIGSVVLAITLREVDIAVVTTAALGSILAGAVLIVLGSQRARAEFCPRD